MPVMLARVIHLSILRRLIFIKLQEFTFPKIVFIPSDKSKKYTYKYHASIATLLLLRIEILI